MSQPDDYHDVLGTDDFKGAQSRQGHQLNMYCMSLHRVQNRARFNADEAAYLDRYPPLPYDSGAARGRHIGAMQQDEISYPSRTTL
jgi:protocatechuate 4,5-dioxygenase alpha chain